VTGQCGCDNVTNMIVWTSSATPQGSQSDSLGFAAKVLDAWTNARPMKCRRTILGNFTSADDKPAGRSDMTEDHMIL